MITFLVSNLINKMVEVVEVVEVVIKIKAIEIIKEMVEILIRTTTKIKVKIHMVLTEIIIPIIINNKDHHNKIINHRILFLDSVEQLIHKVLILDRERLKVKLLMGREGLHYNLNKIL